MIVLGIKIFIDLLIVGLLVATIAYCYKVNRRIVILQDSKEDFAKLIAQFDKTTQHAQESIGELQSTAKKVNESLDERLDKANFLADDLAFLIEKGNRVVDKVEKSVPGANNLGRDSLVPPKREPRNTPVESDTKAKRSSSLRNRNVEDTIKSLRNNRDDNEKNVSESRRAGRSNPRLRSKAERELFNAMKSGSDS